jgi:hypothetical protein
VYMAMVVSWQLMGTVFFTRGRTGHPWRCMFHL